MNKHYLDIDYRSNCFYEYSKDAQEGFKKHTNGAGKVSYRKLYESGVFGVLQSVSVIDSKYQGKKLIVRLLQGNDVYLAGFPLYDQRGNLDNKFVEPLITLLPNLVKDQAYRLFPWAMEDENSKTKDGKVKVRYGVSIKEADLDNLTVEKDDSVKVFPKYTRCKKDETFDKTKHIPDLDFVEEFGSLKPTAISLDSRKRFLIDVLTKSLEILDYKQENSNESTGQQPKPTPKKEAPKEDFVDEGEATGEKIEEEDYEDLPF